MTLAEELANKLWSDNKKRNGQSAVWPGTVYLVAAINEAIEKCAEVAESGGVNVADPETAARIRALKG